MSSLASLQTLFILASANISLFPCRWAIIASVFSLRSLTRAAQSTGGLAPKLLPIANEIHGSNIFLSSPFTTEKKFTAIFSAASDGCRWIERSLIPRTGVVIHGIVVPHGREKQQRGAKEGETPNVRLEIFDRCE